MTRSERQALVIEKWKNVRCKGTFVGCTGVGGPVTTILVSFYKLK